jgi:hypothetical protein
VEYGDSYVVQERRTSTKTRGDFVYVNVSFKTQLPESLAVPVYRDAGKSGGYATGVFYIVTRSKSSQTDRACEETRMLIMMC